MPYNKKYDKYDILYYPNQNIKVSFQRCIVEFRIKYQIIMTVFYGCSGTALIPYFITTEGVQSTNHSTTKWVYRGFENCEQD